jgi:hypothetical protein
MCGSHGGGEMCLQGFLLGGLKLKDHWVDVGVGGRITFSWTLDLREIGIDWANCIQLAQDSV